jgi:hypothetical protein
VQYRAGLFLWNRDGGGTCLSRVLQLTAADPFLNIPSTSGFKITVIVL